VPPLVLESDEDRRLHAIAERRAERRRAEEHDDLDDW
jgi:hypothetical protein